MSRTQGQAIFHLVAMIGFVGVGVGLAAPGYHVTIVGALGLNVIERAAPPADTERQTPARR